MGAKGQIRGHLAASLTIFIWGITFINTKMLLLAFSPVEILVFRLVLAVLALSIVSPPRPEWRKPDLHALRDEWKYLAAGLCGVTLYFLFQNIALTYNLAAITSVLISIAPLFTALLSRLVAHEKLKPAFFLGSTAAILGIALIAFNGRFVLKLNPLGDLLCILAALAWACYSVLVKKISLRHTTVIAMTRKVVFYGFLLVLLVLPFFDFHLGLERLVVLPNLLNLLFLGVGASALCFFTWNVAVHPLGPVKTSVYFYLVPIVTIVAALLVLHEKITLLAWAGIALILAGVALSELRTQPSEISASKTSDFSKNSEF